MTFPVVLEGHRLIALRDTGASTSACRRVPDRPAT